MTLTTSPTVKEINLLKLAFEQGMINLGELDQEIRMKNEKEYLEQHKSKIWQGINEYWYTWVLVEGKRKLIKKREQKDLEKYLIEHYKALDPENDPTFKQEYECWIKSKREYHEVKESSILRYEDVYKQFFTGTEFENLKISEIDDLILDDFVRGRIGELSLTAKAYSGLRTVLLGVFKYAKRKHHTDLSISLFFKDLSFSKSAFKKPSNKRREIYKKSERVLLYSYLMENPTIENLGLALMCLTGLRVGELASLKYEDNFEKFKLYIHRTESRVSVGGKRRMAVTDSAKMGHDSTITITKDAQRIIDIAHMQTNDSEYLFSRKGVRVTARVFRHHLKKACEAVGIKYRPPHQMRKTYASILLGSGIDEAIVKKEMRHTEIATTRSYYQYVTDDISRERAILESVVTIS